MENPSREYKKLMKKIDRLELFRQRNMAISLLSEELNRNRFTIYEQSSGLIRLGLIYVSLKNYLVASKLFDQALRLVKDKPFPYHPNFMIIFETFNKANKTCLLDFWKEDFLQRIEYDNKYQRLFKSLST